MVQSILIMGKIFFYYELPESRRASRTENKLFFFTEYTEVTLATLSFSLEVRISEGTRGVAMFTVGTQQSAAGMATALLAGRVVLRGFVWCGRRLGRADGAEGGA